MTVPFARGSRGRLTTHDLGRFPGETLFDKVARAVCAAGCLPRKELYEAWEVARRVRRVFRGGRVVDLGAGHGLVGQILLILDDSSPAALIADPSLPPSAAKLHAALASQWPRMRERIAFATASAENIPLGPGDVVVSSHACGGLTDVILDRAAGARARVAVLPCCHHLAAGTRPLAGWLDGALAIDVMRAVALERRGYRVRTQTIPAAITPKNRLLIGEPIAPS